jgi:transcriptional regulator with XRE-family HTH domain
MFDCKEKLRNNKSRVSVSKIAGSILTASKTRSEKLLSTTLQEGLQRYSIGEKLRALRLKKKVGLVDLGRHTGLSPALLSKIERGKMFPTLPTLLRIALVFSVGLDFFFSDERKRQIVAIVRGSERLRFPEKPDAAEVGFHFECLDFPAVERKLNAYLAEFHPLAPAKVRVHQHSGIEFIFITSGKLGLRIGEVEHSLEKDDSIYFDSNLPHGYRRIGSSPCSALVVTIP